MRLLQAVVSAGLARGLSSVDEALALVERAYPGTWWFMAKGKQSEDEALFGVHLIAEGNVAGDSFGNGEGETLPAAIIAALSDALDREGRENAC